MKNSKSLAQAERPPVSIFDAFNARNLKPEEVAATFVPSDSFHRLTESNHSLVVGARGSGKTTLLKMLHPAALGAWEAPEADDVRAHVSYTGVFVPSDITWRRQLDAFRQTLPATEEALAALLVRGAFTVHTLRRFTETLRYLAGDLPLSGKPYLSIPLDRMAEFALVDELSALWRVRPRVRTLRSLQYALGDALTGFGSSVLEAQYLQRFEPPKNILDIATLPLLPTLSGAIDRVNDFAGHHAAHWAFLFDELELAPHELLEEIIALLRSTDERILLKLSLSPASNAAPLLHGVLSAMPEQDYTPIRLWHPYKEDGRQFSERLVTAMLRARGIDCSPIEAFGQSTTEITRNDWHSHGTAYYRSSPALRSFEKLQKRDPSFQHFLQDKGIDLRKPDLLASTERAATLRKIAPAVAVRETYREAEGHKRKVRTRKNPRLYAGASSLFAILEGNPRLLIGVVNRLLDRHERVEDIAPGASRAALFSASWQAIEVDHVSGVFKSLLRVFRISSSHRGKAEDLLGVIEKVGDFIHHSVVVAPFTADPVGSFRVDSGVSPGIERSLGEAVNAGAVVHVPDDESPLLLGTTVGQRFRLSYLLAPSFGLPLHLGREINLSTIISRHRVTQVELFT